MALPVLLCLAGAASARPSLLQGLVRKPSPGAWLLLAFAAWVVLSAAWSPYPAAAQAAKLAALVPLGLVFAAAARDGPASRWTLAGGLAAFVVLSAALTVEAALGMPLNRAAQPEADLFELGRNLSRGAIVLLALSWPAAAWLLAGGGLPRAALAVLVLAAGAALSLPFDQLAHVAAVAAGLLAFALACLAPRASVLIASWGFAAWALAAPFVTPFVLSRPGLVERLPDSWAVRAGIWEYVCARILEQPWIGHGLDASRAVTDRMHVRGLDIRTVPLHPHSASLQVWYETGAVGALLAASALFFGGWAIARAASENRVGAAAAAATIASLGVIANVSYGAWQEWWIATMLVAAALVVALLATRGAGTPYASGALAG